LVCGHQAAPADPYRFKPAVTDQLIDLRAADRERARCIRDAVKGRAAETQRGGLVTHLLRSLSAPIGATAPASRRAMVNAGSEFGARRAPSQKRRRASRVVGALLG